MSKNPKTKRILVNLLIILFLTLGTLAAVQFAKGYRPDLQNKGLKGTGLLSVTSYPKSARVIINDLLTTVTDDKLYLSPANYNIKIEKDGFHPWVKAVPIKSELVSSADARLFPIITATTPLTFYQVLYAATNPDYNRIIYSLDNSPVETTNGLYIHTLQGNFLGSANVQIADNSRDWANSLLVWSPDSSQILAVFYDTVTTKDTKTKTSIQTEKITSAILLSTKGMNNVKTLADVTLRLPLIVSEWRDQYVKINQPILSLYPRYMTDILANKAINVYFSPDKEKVFYTPTIDIVLPENEIGKALPIINSTKEERSLIKDNTYIFDLKEGTNYQLPYSTKPTAEAKTLITSTSATPSASMNDLRQLKYQTEVYDTTNVSWYSNSRQIIVNNENGTNIADYDGLNLTNITYVRPQNGFVVSSSDGSKLIMLTNINQKPDNFNLISFDLK